MVYFLFFFLSSSFDTLIMCILTCLIIYIQVFWVYIESEFIFLHSLFSFYISDCIISIDLFSNSWILSFANSNLIWTPCNEFLFLSFYFSQFPFEKKNHFYDPILFEFFFGLFQLFLLWFFIHMIFFLRIPIFYFNMNKQLKVNKMA